jgi:hypothetical protein
MAGKFRKSPQDAGQQDCVVAHAPLIEPVSECDYPVKWEKFREIHSFGQ